MAQLSAVSTEAWLTAVITALYLKDCVRLLQPDEAMLQRGWLGHWSARFGARNFRLAHREPLLLNPFLPHQRNSPTSTVIALRSRPQQHLS